MKRALSFVLQGCGALLILAGFALLGIGDVVWRAGKNYGESDSMAAG